METPVTRGRKSKTTDDKLRTAARKLEEQGVPITKAAVAEVLGVKERTLGNKFGSEERFLRYVRDIRRPPGESWKARLHEMAAQVVLNQTTPSKADPSIDLNKVPEDWLEKVGEDGFDIDAALTVYKGAAMLAEAYAATRLTSLGDRLKLSDGRYQKILTAWIDTTATAVVRSNRRRSAARAKLSHPSEGSETAGDAMP